MNPRIAIGWALSAALGFCAGSFLSSKSPEAHTPPHPSPTAISPTGPRTPSGIIAPGAAAGESESTAKTSSKLPKDDAELRAYVRNALAEGRAFNRISRVTDILAGMDRTNAAAIQGEIEASIQSGRRLITEKLLLEYRVGEVLGRDAAEALRPADPEQLPTEGFRNVISGWGGADPTAAMTWFNGLPDGKFRDEALRWVINGVCSHDLEHGATIFSGLPPDLQINASNQMFWNYVQARGPAGTEPWVSGLVQQAQAANASADQVFLAGKMIGDLTNRWLHESPEAAASFLSRQGSTAPGAQEAARTVIQKWLGKDSASAEKWAAQFVTPPKGTGQ